MKTKRMLAIALIFFILLFNLIDLKIYASNDNDGFYQSTITLNGTEYPCFEYYNPSALSTGLELYWVENGFVMHAPFSNYLQVALNKKFGLVFSQTWFTNFVSFFDGYVVGASAAVESFFTGNIYRVSNGSDVCGIALDNLVGYKLDGDNGYTSVNVPSTVQNFSYNVVNNYLDANPITPDFINVVSITKTEAISYMNPSYTGINYNDSVSYINSHDNMLCFYYHNWTSQSNKYGTVGSMETQNDTVYNGASFNISDTDILVATNGFTNTVNNFSLTENDNTVSYNDLLNFTGSNRLQISTYDSNWNHVYYPRSTINGTSTTVNSNYMGFLIKDGWNYLMPCTSNGKTFTVYKDATIPANIQNNTYKKTIYKSTIYKNYNTNNDNSVNITKNEINNSTQSSNDVYNQTSTTTNENTYNNNYYYDESYNDNSTTTIINNYYGDNSGDGDNGDDDDDDSPIWDALLNAIVDFFKKIGEIIAAILTGILGLLSSVLDAIANITEGFTGITSFISSVFGFLPDEIIAVLMLGITTALLVSLIRMIRK